MYHTTVPYSIPYPTVRTIPPYRTPYRTQPYVPYHRTVLHTVPNRTYHKPTLNRTPTYQALQKTPLAYLLNLDNYQYFQTLSRARCSVSAPRRSIWKHLRRKYCHFEKVAPNSLNVTLQQMDLVLDLKTTHSDGPHGQLIQYLNLFQCDGQSCVNRR